MPVPDISPAVEAGAGNVCNISLLHMEDHFIRES